MRPGRPQIRSLNSALIPALLVGWLLVESCSDSSGSSPTSPPSGITDWKFSTIQSQIFDVSCAGPSCHGSGKGGLTLTAGLSYSQLVNVDSENDGDHVPPFKRVRPGAPDSSFLIVKLVGPSGRQGTRMPQSAGMLAPEIISGIRSWIAQGAPNN